MADRKLTVRIDLKPGDLRELRTATEKELSALQTAGGSAPSRTRSGPDRAVEVPKPEKLDKLEVVDTQKESLKRLQEAFLSPLTGAKTALSEGGGAIAEKLGSGGVAAAGLAGGAATGIGLVVAGTAALGIGAKKLLDTANSFAAIASPVQAERLSKSWDDLYAVIGRSFIPVTELTTDAVRLLGDAMASIMPSSSGVREAMAPMREIMDGWRQSLQDLAPYLRQAGIETVALAGATARLLKEAGLGNALNVGLPRTDQSLASAFGAAGAPASYSSIEEYGRRNQATAYSGAAPDTGKDVGEIKNLTQKIYEQLKPLVKLLTDPIAGPGTPSIARAAYDVGSAAMGNPAPAAETLLNGIYALVK